MSSEVVTPSAETSAGEKMPRRAYHVMGALMIAILFAVGLLMTRFSGPEFRRNRMVLVQAGVKADLNLISSLQAKYFAARGMYTTDLNALGVNPKIVYYKFGFVRPSEFREPGTNPDIKDLDLLKKAVPKSSIELSEATRLSEIAFSYLEKFCPDCTATPTSFKAVAAANLDSDPDLDVWTVDEKGTIVHVADDLKLSN